MALRFRKSIRLGKGVKLNINKKSLGLTVGTKGFHHTINTSGRKTTSVGIPGTGLYYQNINNTSTPKNSGSHKTTPEDELEAMMAVEEDKGNIKKMVFSLIFILLSVFIATKSMGIGIVFLIISILMFVKSMKRFSPEASEENPEDPLMGHEDEAKK